MNKLNNSENTANTNEVQKDRNTFKFAYAFLLVDYISRWIILELWSYEIINGVIFWFGHFVIAFVVIICMLRRDTWLKKKYGIDITFPEGTTWNILFWIFIVLSGVVITFSLYPYWPIWGRISFSIGALFLYGSYTTVVATFSVQKTNKEEYNREYDALADDSQIAVDANDVRIIRMETEIASISNRIESFTLESALFGALAFSGFLTLIAAEKPILQNTQDFISNISNVVYAVRDLDLDLIKSLSVGIATTDCLLGAIAVQTLVCSMFFVSVIVSRLRFYNILKKVDYAIRVARGYNDKEEQAYLLFLQQHGRGDLERNDKSKAEDLDKQYLLDSTMPVDLTERLHSLTAHVTDAINNADPLFRDLLFVTRFIWGLRNMGIIAFVLILLTSALLVSKNIALLSLALFLSALLYTVLDAWVRNKKLHGNPFFAALEKRIFRMKEKKVGSNTANL